MSLSCWASVPKRRPLRLFSILLTAVVLFCAAFEVPAHERPKLKLDNLKRAVVIVTTFDRAGQPLLQGSGFFITPNEIVTNNHVITNAHVIQIKTFAGNTFSVQTVIATDAAVDLALLSVSVRSEVVLAVAGAPPREGESITLLSNPQGCQWRVTRGEARRVWQFASTGNRLQITAGVFPGSSGGPVLNERGQVVGIAVMRMDSGDDLNFAVPSASLTKLMNLSAQTERG
jgi:S1-C subfamily serine protease